MRIAEDLLTLQDLYEKGKITNQEFAIAKAAALQKHDSPECGPLILHRKIHRRPNSRTETRNILRFSFSCLSCQRVPCHDSS
jgi:hypothetical protein